MKQIHADPETRRIRGTNRSQRVRSSAPFAAEKRPAVAELLNSLLADEFVLYAKTRNYHWNVRGIHFRELHKLFEEQYEKLDEILDEVAERVRTCGGLALGTLSEFLDGSRLREQPGRYPDSRAMIGDLLRDHEEVIDFIREAVVRCDDEFGDVGTSNFLADLLQDHEKMAWMLEATIENDVRERREEEAPARARR
ncbi:MAG TPA: DNA starvation/stationary phase protection protein [Planctomycetota bacterium]|jgi:starvation-inducible DNA-binding protein|nr:DNA starvation/stationary phase protection protein [Planctomycetota bacterium]